MTAKRWRVFLTYFLDSYNKEGKLHANAMVLLDDITYQALKNLGVTLKIEEDNLSLVQNVEVVHC